MTAAASLPYYVESRRLLGRWLAESRTEAWAQTNPHQPKAEQDVDDNGGPFLYFPQGEGIWLCSLQTGSGPTGTQAGRVIAAPPVLASQRVAGDRTHRLATYAEYVAEKESQGVRKQAYELQDQKIAGAAQKHKIVLAVKP
jgi:hypothetical protein